MSTDARSRALQAFWAMHVEAMNWSGMSVREYATALHLSPTSLRKWRHRLDDGEVHIDWREHLHPSARPGAGTSANRTPPGTGLTAPPTDASGSPRQPLRRFFADEQKRAIELESDQPGVSVSQVARKHGIVTGLLFRWRVQFGVAQRKRAKLAPVALSDDAPAILRLRDLVQPPDGMTAIDLPAGRRVFAPAGVDLHAVREHLIGEGADAMMIVPAGVKVHLALGYTDMRKGLDGLAMLVQQALKQDPFSGHLFAFRGKKASMLKILFWDGNGLCLFTKRLDQGAFVLADDGGYEGSITLTPAQLAMLIEGIDWRAPERVWRPALAG